MKNSRDGIEGYWDDVTYATFKTRDDSARIEERFRQFVPLLYQVSDDSAKVAIQAFLGKRFLQNYAMTLAVKYLYDADSPLEDEEMLLRFFNEADFSRLDVRNLYYYDLISKNRVGTQAADFAFESRDGKIMNLRDLDSDHILLVFFDPECPHCKDILKEIEQNSLFAQMIDSGELLVLLVYTEGNKDIWEKHKWSYPASWIVGIDCQGIVDSDLYDLKVMPLVYFLGKNRLIEDKEIDIKTLSVKMETKKL